jgi:uncharacterized membrane protein
MTAMTTKIQIAALGAVFLLLALGMAGPGPLLPGLGPALGPAFGPLGGVAVIFLVGAIAIPFLARGFRERTPPHDAATHIEWEEILRMRYAKGEIDRAQFMTMMNDLRNGGAGTP